MTPQPVAGDPAAGSARKPLAEGKQPFDAVKGGYSGEEDSSSYLYPYTALKPAWLAAGGGTPCKIGYAGNAGASGRDGAARCPKGDARINCKISILQSQQE